MPPLPQTAKERNMCVLSMSLLPFFVKNFHQNAKTFSHDTWPEQIFLVEMCWLQKGFRF